MNFERVMQLIGEWAGTIRYFPSDPEARIGIAKQIAKFAENEFQVRWLVDILPNHFPDWPAIHEVRAIFCMKFKPKDGVEAASHIFPEGLEKYQLNPGKGIALPAPPVLQLPPGEPASADPLLVTLLTDASQGKAVNAKINYRPIEKAELKPGESELQALIRQIEESPVDPLANVAPATEEEIRHTKALQDAQHATPK